MTTKELIGQIRKSRVINNSHHMSQLKKQIVNLRKEIVSVSFESKPNLDKHKELLLQLKQCQQEYLAIANDG